MLICGGISLHLSFNSMFYIASDLIKQHPLNFWRKYDETKEEKSYKRKIAAIDSVCKSSSAIDNKTCSCDIITKPSE